MLDQISALLQEVNEMDGHSEQGTYVEVVDVKVTGYSNRPASRPGAHGTHVLEKGTRSTFRTDMALSRSMQLGARDQLTPKPSAAAAQSRQPVALNSVDDSPPQQNAPPKVVKDLLRKANVYYHYVYGFQCPYTPCTFNDEAARISQGHHHSTPLANQTTAVLATVFDMKDS